jgi:hypothetical protein
MVYKLTDNQDLGLLKIIKEFLLIRAEIINQGHDPDKI